MPGFRSMLRLGVMLLALAGGGRGRGAETTTLADSKLLPVKSIEEFLSAADWQYLRARKITRLVAFRAQIRSDASVRPGRIFRTYPDAAWNEIARGFAAKARLNYTTSSSGLTPGANLYVVFFEPESTGITLVLVYGEETGSGGRPAEAPDPSGGQSAAGPRYAQTFPIEPSK